MPLRKVLLDECVDSKFARHITGYEVQTVRGAGWDSLRNGDLLHLAQADFDLLVTTDRSLIYQQNLPKFDIAVIVLMAKSNNVHELLPFAPKLLDAIPTIEPGTALVLTAP
uniref:DUF5615 domain-containing protein n=1 Tax=Candidatus Kentrum sp. DK TaxID=2126562 RepID=A0A450TQ23_9GAMM|nr:MAG: hypothetical protein BECKDK2373B_GA0170837_12672 [Candidatus Kentron sp. DK]